MWGIGILIIIAAYVVVIRLACRLIKPVWGKVFVVIFSIGTPFLYPSYYKISPSYATFIEYCDSKDRKIIYETVMVDYLYLGDSRACYKGLKYLDQYTAVECSVIPTENGIAKGKYRYSKGDDWLSPSCRSDCIEHSFSTNKQRCMIDCAKVSDISEFTFPYNVENERVEIIANKLYASRKIISSNGKVLAEVANLQYYPYGNTWATILGLSSGTPPTHRCSKHKSLEVTEVFYPR